MGTVTTETAKPYPYTDIADITFTNTADRPGEITVQIFREAPPVEKIDLGIPEKAVGRLRWLDYRNFAWSLIKAGAGTVVGGDGIGKLVAGGLHSDIVGACEIAVGGSVAVYSLCKMVLRSNRLDAVKGSLGKRINSGFLSSLNTADANSPKTPGS